MSRELLKRFKEYVEAVDQAKWALRMGQKNTAYQILDSLSIDQKESECKSPSHQAMKIGIIDKCDVCGAQD